MHSGPQIFLKSSNLYKDLYQAFFITEDGNMPPSFVYNGQFQVRLIHQCLEENNANDQDHSQNAYLDDRYDALKSCPNSCDRTIWYNPGGEMVNHELPFQDVDILKFESLKDISRLLDKPTLAQCLAWWEEWEMPDNIRRHSTVVARSAYVLAVKMREKGITLDPILAHRAGLIHDIDKIDTLHEGGAHGVMGADFLQAQGYPEMAKIVRDHIMSTIINPEAKSRSWENKLVFFCDKLVEGDELVPFDQRLEALRARYPYYVEKMAEAEPYIWEMSDEICEILGIGSHAGMIEMLKEME